MNTDNSQMLTYAGFFELVKERVAASEYGHEVEVRAMINERDPESLPLYVWVYPTGKPKATLMVEVDMPNTDTEDDAVRLALDDALAQVARGVEHLRSEGKLG